MDVKFVDELAVEDWEVETPTGWSSIEKVFKTVPFSIWRLTAENGHVLEAADTHLVLTKEFGLQFVKDIALGTHIQSKEGWQEILSIELLPDAPVNMYDIEIDSTDHLYYSNGLVSHNTTTVAAYLLYEAVFNEKKDIAVLANKGDTAAEILNRIKDMFENLPWFLKPGVREWNKRSISLTNGSKVFSAATSSSSIRGRSINCVTSDTEITIENDNGEVEVIKISDLFQYSDLKKYRKEGDGSTFLVDEDFIVEETTNKYHKIYNQIIDRAKSENRTRGSQTDIIYENHHIIPKSLGGGNDKDNLVLLTLKEHFVCHKLLTKMYTGKAKAKMYTALFLMSNTRKGMRISSKEYEKVKLFFRERVSNFNKGKKHHWQNKINKNPDKIKKTADKHRGMKRSQETKERISKAKKEFFATNGSKSVGYGMIYVHNSETKEVKRVSKDFVIEYPWVKGSGISKNGGTKYIHNPNTGEVRRVSQDFIVENPMKLGKGPKRK